MKTPASKARRSLKIGNQSAFLDLVWTFGGSINETYKQDKSNETVR